MRGRKLRGRGSRRSSRRLGDAIWLGLANGLVFPAIRKKMIGENLKALICGSAPLSVETQLYFMMLGIRVLQVYGLTETTAICTMDDPNRVEVGRVGPAIPGMEMRLGENDEILVRGPNIFPGYWNRPEQTAEALRDGWFHTGDQGEVDAAGNWRIAGRIKNLIILGSGHKISPEPIEECNCETLAGSAAGGGGRKRARIFVGDRYRRCDSRESAGGAGCGESRVAALQAGAGVSCIAEAFSIENGLLTANGKLKRDVIAARMKNEIEDMYRVKQAV